MGAAACGREEILMKSMTGYGRAREQRGGRDITVEVRSVNNRYLDCTVKMPRAYIFAEDAVKSRVQKAVSRGKVDVFISVDSLGAEETVVSVNEPLAKAYISAFTRLRELGAGQGVREDFSVTDLARIPDVLTVTKAEEDLESADLALTMTKTQAEQVRTNYEAQIACMSVGTFIDMEEEVPEVTEDTPEAFEKCFRSIESLMEAAADRIIGELLL